MTADRDSAHMARALALATRGEGAVEPNPMVGCVIVRDDAVVGEGWHQQFGGPHAEIEALRIAGQRANGATLYVTLEPCSHFGKTPPCADAILRAGVQRVVIAQIDPFLAVAGEGVRRLREGGLVVDVGLHENEARELNAPYLTRVTRGRPWIIAKWAMTLDGKIATHTGDSRWISSEASREIVHRLRGRMDAILVGRGTVERDNPLLTARPRGPRVAARVVLDRLAALSPDSQLVRTVGDAAVCVVAGPDAPPQRVRDLREAGCEVWSLSDSQPSAMVGECVAEMGRRGWTNVLVEGGSTVLGALFDARLIDEVHVFIAGKLVGGSAAPSPLGGLGVARIREALAVDRIRWSEVGGDLYACGRIASDPP